MDELTEDYRRASAEQAGLPSAASRAAILAEARAQAAARTKPPAANGSRFLWSAAASVVVAGFGLLLWREVSRTPEASRQIAESLGAAPSSAPPAQPAPPEPMPTQAADSAIATDAAKAATNEEKREESERVVVDLRLREPIPETVFMPPPPVAQAAAPTRDAGERFARSAGSAPPTREAPESLLQRAFPDAMNADSPPASVWVLQDAGGRIARRGVLPQAGDLGAVTRELQAAFPRRRIGAFAVRPAVNARGRTVQVASAQLDCQDAADASFCAEAGP